jgi:hypothetical protein
VLLRLLLITGLTAILHTFKIKAAGRWRAVGTMVVVFIALLVVFLWLCLLRKAVGFESTVGPIQIKLKPTYVGFSIKIQENIRFLLK